MRPSLARLTRMDAREIAWRATAAARIAAGRARFRVAHPCWSRARLSSALTGAADLASVRAALAGARWADAHRELSRHFVSAPRRFAIEASDRELLARRIAADHPGSAEHAALRADRLVAGDYDLLGYRGLHFGRPLPDWSFDAASVRRAPGGFWADVPYLDPGCGDHKVIWELNRHQHWIALGRAYWLTGRAVYRARVLDELASWLDANPPLTGINWASMLELAFRAISWLWTIHLFVDDPDHAAHADRTEPPWLVDLLIALDRQLTHVEHHLSYYFSPNTHLIGEGLALYVCGRALPELAASPRREALGRRILLAEIESQIAHDGGHVERSTHYHRYTLDFYILALVVARATGDEVAGRFADAVARLGTAARLLADDHGRMPHLGDDDGGMLLPIAGRTPDDLRDSLATAAALTGRSDLRVGPPPEETLWMLCGFGDIVDRDGAAAGAIAAPAPRSGALPQTGYYVSRSAAEHVVIDGGPHGFRNGGHAHADALSLTLSVRGLPLLIDPGTGCYTVDPALRDRMRSSPLHNTLTIDGRGQSVPHGPFHWAEVANTRVEAWRANDAFDYFDGAHDGYAPVEHRRRVLTVHGDLVVVADLVSGDAAHAAAAHWHLDPRWNVDARGRRIVLTRGGERVTLAAPGGTVDAVSADAASGLGWYSPTYGAVEPTTTLRVSHAGPAPFWMASVFDLGGGEPIADVEWMPIWAEAGVMAHGVALRIARAASVDYVLFAEPAADAGGRTVAAAGMPGAPRWRVGEIETDARMLFVRVADDRPVARLALVDGSMVRTTGRRGVLLALPHRATDLYLDFTAGARVAGPTFGARLVVGGHEQPLERDRRAEPRT